MEHAAVPGDVRAQRLSAGIEAYSEAILRTCFVYLADRQLAEDAMQDTFLKAWKAMPQYEKSGVGQDKAWLMRIAINTCKDYRRGQWFRHVDIRSSLEDLPPRLLAVEMEDRTMTLSIAGLPDRLKQVILLYYYQNLTMRETAQALGVSPSTVMKRLAKAEALLKGSLTGGEE